jgi:hypothetical protein
LVVEAEQIPELHLSMRRYGECASRKRRRYVTSPDDISCRQRSGRYRIGGFCRDRPAVRRIVNSKNEFLALRRDLPRFDILLTHKGASRRSRLVVARSDC